MPDKEQSKSVLSPILGELAAEKQFLTPRLSF